MTNGDRIRSMTDEELSVFLSESRACHHCKYNIGDKRCFDEIICTKEHVMQTYKEWLSSEYEYSES